MNPTQKRIQRRSGRFVTKLKARYFLSERKAKLQECTIFNISPQGIGAEFYERPEAGSSIHLIIDIPGETQQAVIVEGSIKWIMKRGTTFKSGIELTKTLDDTIFAKLT